MLRGNNALINTLIWYTKNRSNKRNAYQADVRIYATYGVKIKIFTLHINKSANSKAFIQFELLGMTSLKAFVRHRKFFKTQSILNNRPLIFTD